MNKDQTLAARKRLLGGNLSISYRNPLKIVRGEMQYLFDDEGRRYVDAYNNVAHVGHCHPRVVAAGIEQMRLLNTNTRYLHDLILRYAERLTATLPEPLRVCYFVNSGSEANELALRLARAHTKAQDMIVLDHAYHGNTTTLVDLSAYKHDGPGGHGAPEWVHKIPLSLDGVESVRAVLSGLKQKRKDLCGFIAESMPSVAGQIVLPDRYLAQVYEAVRAAGGVCIADEVQTGYGRIGTHFWAFEHYGVATDSVGAGSVVPDIVVLGKPIGNGHPIGAVITTPEIAHSFDNGMEFFSTFGGNTVSCAIGLAVLDVVREENLQDHALKVGTYLLENLRELQRRYGLIHDVRGSGFFIGVELTSDDAPATTQAEAIVNHMRERGILLGTEGPHHNVLKIRPPMPFSMEDADLLVGVLAGAIEQEGK
jgi:4-aminobutyrate aminotransferase-like enzyme